MFSVFHWIFASIFPNRDKHPILLSALILLCLFTIISNGQKLTDPTSSSKSVKLGKCGACSQLVDSFMKGFEKTKNGKLGGGDTHWEENNQKGGYKTSEVRLIEIEEDHLCKDVNRSKSQCLENASQWSELLEEWWSAYWKSTLDDTQPPLDMKQWLCIDKLKHCCPANHFGPDCSPCLGSNGLGSLICSGNGRCKGNGTRVGNGLCLCDSGYTSDLCDACASGFYSSYKDTTKILCSPCHKSCKDVCSGPGPQSCTVCRAGYVMDREHGCSDIDECVMNDNKICHTNEFCVNTEGSYRCLKCDKACKDGCDGDGPDSCFECATGFIRSESQKPAEDDPLSNPGSDARAPCVSERTAGMIVNLSKTRFVTYSGLGVATIIIFQRSPPLAGLLGAVIAVYVTFSEYFLMVNSTAS